MYSHCMDIDLSFLWLQSIKMSKLQCITGLMFQEDCKQFDEIIVRMMQQEKCTSINMLFNKLTKEIIYPKKYNWL